MIRISWPLQGILFYVPHWIWKNWEEGKVRMISEGMRGALIGAKEERLHRQSRLVQYLVETLHLHNSYAFGYFLCEGLNFFNVVSNCVKTTHCVSHLIVADNKHIYDRQVSWRCISKLRHGCHSLLKYESGEPNRSHGGDISACHQVHFSQVWSDGFYTKA